MTIPASAYVRQHTSQYVSIRCAYLVSIRCAYLRGIVKDKALGAGIPFVRPLQRIRQHTSAYVSIRCAYLRGNVKHKVLGAVIPFVRPPACICFSPGRCTNCERCDTACVRGPLLLASLPSSISYPGLQSSLPAWGFARTRSLLKASPIGAAGSCPP